MRRRIAVTAAVLVVLVLGTAGFIAFVGVQVGPNRNTLTGLWVADGGATMNLNANDTFNASGFSRCVGPLYYRVPDPDRGPAPEDAVTVDQAEGTWDYGPESDYTNVKALILRFRSPKAFTAYWNVSEVTWQFHTKTMSIIKSRDENNMPGTVYCGFVAHG
jgi:hypothetical protein